MEENKAGKQPQELADFIFGYFLKGKGLMSAVVEVSSGAAVKSLAFCTLHSTSGMESQQLQSSGLRSADCNKLAAYFQPSPLSLLSLTVMMLALLQVAAER